MKSMEKEIFDYLSRKLSPKRFEHSYNVSVLASELAEIHGENILKAQTAGLLHDCAKSMTDKQMISFLKNKNVKIPYFKEMSEKSPQLLHSFAAAEIAKEKFGIKDADLLNAIKSHTLGREDMSLLEKIIFVADSASVDRKCKHSAGIRKLARKDIEKAFIKALSKKITYIIGEKEPIFPQTIITWNYYVS